MDTAISLKIMHQIIYVISTRGIEKSDYYSYLALLKRALFFFDSFIEQVNKNPYIQIYNVT